MQAGGIRYQLKLGRPITKAEKFRLYHNLYEVFRFHILTEIITSPIMND